MCRAEDVPPEGVIQICPPDRDVEYAIYRLGDEYFCSDDICTHGLVSLSNGDVENGQIFCPLHGGAFDIRTGAATELPCRVRLRIYRVELIDGELFAALD